MLNTGKVRRPVSRLPRRRVPVLRRVVSRNILLLRNSRLTGRLNVLLVSMTLSVLWVSGLDYGVRWSTINKDPGTLCVLEID